VRTFLYQQPSSRQRSLSTAYVTNHIAEVVSLVSVSFFRKHWNFLTGMHCLFDKDFVIEDLYFWVTAMEGVPQLPMLSAPLKTTPEKSDFASKIRWVMLRAVHGYEIS
jgi:hypothetical protein